MTDDLIASLAADLKPVRPGAIARRLTLAILAALILAVPAMLTLLGLRADLANAISTPIFWIKFAYTLAVGVFGILAVNRLASPGRRANGPLLAALAAFAVVVVLGIAQFMTTTGDARTVIVLGSSALRCPFYIFGLSLPFLGVNLLLLRRLAPTNLPLAGLAAGLMAGALGAWVYSFHCGEEGLPFLALWYTLGMLATAALGAAMGRFALRW